MVVILAVASAVGAALATVTDGTTQALFTFLAVVNALMCIASAIRDGGMR